MLSLSMGSMATMAQEAPSFINPPQPARPRVWWHWLDGNISQDGIRKDLEWMHRAGIGGFQTFDGGFGQPLIIDKKVAYMTPEWKEAFRLTTHLADSLGMEIGIASSPGWSATGGPWVSPEDGMKKLTWRETDVEGGRLIEIDLPKPYRTTGRFLDEPLPEKTVVLGFTFFATKAEMYRDVRVIAYRQTDEEAVFASLKPDTIKGETLTLDYHQPVTVRAVTVCDGGNYAGTPARKWLQSSDDGTDFRDVCELQTSAVPYTTTSIPTTKARYFRIRFEEQGNGHHHVRVFQLHPSPRICHSEEKAGFSAGSSLENYPTLTDGTPIVSSDIIDLTDRVDAEGHLHWQAPKGHWHIIRFGWSLTGKENHPATREATGLEVDKMDKAAFTRYLTHYLDMYRDASGGRIGQHGVQYILNDSYEAGQATWTPLMAQEFARRRGYDLLPWMPVLTGKVVDSTEASERFLWDWRKTIGELIVENSYEVEDSILAAYGMAGRYSESHESGRAYVADGMEVKRHAAIPMAAQWVIDIPWVDGRPLIQSDIRESASVAHIYGQNLVAGESLTSIGLDNKAWSYYPGNLKASVDNELANGLNRFFIHTSPHQPVDDKQPGLGLYIFGQWFDRHDTWAEQARAWTDYLARSSYMLQRGQYVADIAYYFGEDNNVANLFAKRNPDIPQGYDFDFINADALINQIKAEGTALVTATGMRYRLLVLDGNVKKMSLPVLRKIAQLAEQGVVICGAKPETPASNSDNQEEFFSLVDKVWNSHRPNVTTGIPTATVIQQMGLQPDFQFRSEGYLRYVHRREGANDIYWVNNMEKKAVNADLTFRVTGRRPRLWNPETGAIEEVSYTIKEKETLVSLQLSSEEAVFIVFDAPADKQSQALPLSEESLLADLSTDWDVTFQPQRGAPDNTHFHTLTSLSSSDIDGIKYFSGTASYTKTISLKAKQLSGKIILDLGEVGQVAEVFVNGQKAGTLWKQPYRQDITPLLRKGKNTLEVRVTNTWQNRLIGDAQPGVTEKVTYTSMPFYTPDAPLSPSGLIGPIRLYSLSAFLGDGKGIYPGRVTLVRDTAVARWDGQTGHWWDEGNIDQEGLERMFSQSLCSLTSTKEASKAWDRLFRHFNKAQRQRNTGYKPGETIAVKVNLNNTFETNDRDNEIDQSSQGIIALVKSLVQDAKVREQDIVIYDASIGFRPRAIPDRIREPVHALFPKVRWMSANGSAGVEQADWVEGAIQYTNPDIKLGNALPEQWSSQPT